MSSSVSVTIRKMSHKAFEPADFVQNGTVSISTTEDDIPQPGSVHVQLTGGFAFVLIFLFLRGETLVLGMFLSSSGCATDLCGNHITGNNEIRY